MIRKKIMSILLIVFALLAIILPNYCNAETVELGYKNIDVTSNLTIGNLYFYPINFRNFSNTSENTELSETNSNNLIEAIIDVIEMIGSESYLYMNFGDLQVTIRINTSDDYERDQRAYMEFDLNKLHIFDKDTEKNILIEQ